MTKRSALAGVVVASFVILSAASPAAAGTFIVKCSPDVPGPGEYASMTDALNAARSMSPRDHVILVHGHCTEIVNIAALDYVAVVGQGGATLSYPASAPADAPVFTLFDTRGIEINNLTIVGSTTVTVDLVRIFYSTVTWFKGVTIRGSGGEGVFITNGSSVQFTDCIIEGHNDRGVRVSRGSNVNFGENTDVSGAADVIIRNNGRVGIDVKENSHVTLSGNVSVLDNGGHGIVASASTISTCCDTGERLISRNSDGIRLTAADFRTTGPLRIDSNRGTGITATTGSRVWINGLSGTHVISGNGGRGVTVARNSSVDIQRTQIENNTSFGVLALDNSTALVSDGSTIRFNGGDGVAAYALSDTVITSSSVITGNGGFDLFCTPDSVGRGSKDGISRVFCPAFNRYPTPDPGSPGSFEPAPAASQAPPDERVGSRQSSSGGGR